MSSFIKRASRDVNLANGLAMLVLFFPQHALHFRDARCSETEVDIGVDCLCHVPARSRQNAGS